MKGQRAIEKEYGEPFLKAVENFTIDYILEHQKNNDGKYSSTEYEYLIKRNIRPSPKNRKEELTQKNIVLENMAGGGKTYRTKKRINKTLSQTDNDTIIYVYDTYCEYDDCSHHKGLVLNWQCNITGGIIHFLKNVYETAYNTTASKKFIVIIEGLTSEKYDIVEFIHFIKKLNSLNIPIQINVQDLADILHNCSDDEKDIYILWFEKNFLTRCNYSKIFNL